MRFQKDAPPRWIRRWCPDEHVQSVAEITPERLQAQGIRALLLDLDNTITPWRSRQVPAEVADWVKQMQAAGVKLCFVSNTRNLGRLQWLSETLGIPYARGPMKPRRAMLRRALEMLNVEPEHAAMVGDQLFTDIWGGNRLGIYNLLQPKLARDALQRKVRAIQQTGATIVASANPGCTLWIRQGLQEAGVPVEVLHPMEILAKAYDAMP